MLQRWSRGNQQRPIDRHRREVIACINQEIEYATNHQLLLQVHCKCRLAYLFHLLVKKMMAAQTQETLRRQCTWQYDTAGESQKCSSSGFNSGHTAGKVVLLVGLYKKKLKWIRICTESFSTSIWQTKRGNEADDWYRVNGTLQIRFHKYPLALSLAWWWVSKVVNQCSGHYYSRWVKMSDNPQRLHLSYDATVARDGSH